MVDRGFHFGGPRFFLKILVDRGLVDRGSEKLSTTLDHTVVYNPAPLGLARRPVLGQWFVLTNRALAPGEPIWVT